MKNLLNLLKLSMVVVSVAYAAEVAATKPAAAPAAAQLAAKPAPAPVPPPLPSSSSSVDAVSSSSSSEPAATSVSKEADADSVSADSVTERKYANRYKEMRQKITVAEYDSIQRAGIDSSFAKTLHHGISFISGNTKDKHLGDVAENQVWGTTFGAYYFYRYYFNPYLAFQGRLGFLFRYARFEDEEDYRSIDYKDKSYDLIDEKTVSFQNYSLDLPLSLKVGGHLDHTTFMFASISVGVTKSLYEKIFVDNAIVAPKASASLSESLDLLEKNGKFVSKESHEISGQFDDDDWEMNSWFGVGLDGKYFGIEYQVLIAANSTKDNHRYYNIFRKAWPTWRLVVDFSLM